VKRPATATATRARRKATTSRPITPASVSPEVIVDFLLEDGLLFVALQNISERPAYDVRVTFDPSFRGLGGEQETSGLRMFKRTPFLAPRRTIKALLDASSVYFDRQEPTSITAHIRYADHAGHPHRCSIEHDLAIYRDLAFVCAPRSGPATGSPTK
jgi:hypothetical protein